MSIADYAQSQENKYVSLVKMGASRQTNEEVLRDILKEEGLTEADLTSIISSFPSYSLTAKHRDTQVGGNDAINSYYQFNENDDIVHPINRTSVDSSSGMGRVYNETFDEQQQLLYLSFGVPEFANAGSFVDTLYDAKLATLSNTGDASVIEAIARAVGFTLGTVLKLPWYPLKFAADLILGNTFKPSKYYDFKPTMSLYYKTVNIILAHLAVNMDLAAEDGATAADVAGVPNLLKTHGLDILTILSRKHYYDDPDNINPASPTADDFLKKVKDDIGFETGIWSGATMGFTEAMQFIGFRIEKSSDSSESASNSTKEPEILSTLNGQARAGRDATFNFSALRETSGGKVLDSAYQALSGLVGGTLSSLGLSGGLELLKGSGYVDIPEIWDSSSFSKSYSFDFQLRTPYGDKFSIFYSLYIPLAMLIAGAFPRSVGRNSYTSPFLVRAYCQGMFAIPLGIIDSITIKRGASEYGWSDDMLPTQIDVSFTIKDLSPIMHIAIAAGGMDDWLSILGENSTFQEYLLTLSGSNIAQRNLKAKQLKNRAKALLKIASNNKLNPLMIGFSLANTKLGRMITQITPVTRLPGADG